MTSYRSKEVGQPPSLAVVDQVANTVSQLNLDGDVNPERKPAVGHHAQPALVISDCKCGMPLCICETPAQSMETEAVPSQVLIFSNSYCSSYISCGTYET